MNIRVWKPTEGSATVPDRLEWEDWLTSSLAPWLPSGPGRAYLCRCVLTLGSYEASYLVHSNELTRRQVSSGADNGHVMSRFLPIFSTKCPTSALKLQECNYLNHLFSLMLLSKERMCPWKYICGEIPQEVKYWLYVMLPPSSSSADSSVSAVMKQRRGPHLHWFSAPADSLAAKHHIKVLEVISNPGIKIGQRLSDLTCWWLLNATLCVVYSEALEEGFTKIHSGKEAGTKKAVMDFKAVTL